MPKPFELRIEKKKLSELAEAFEMGEDRAQVRAKAYLSLSARRSEWEFIGDMIGVLCSLSVLLYISVYLCQSLLSDQALALRSGLWQGLIFPALGTGLCSFMLIPLCRHVTREILWRQIPSDLSRWWREEDKLWTMGERVEHEDDDDDDELSLRREEAG
ncbi:MAG: hypothetical protein EOP06_03750 [Proteobacteria bacterium]|nr:MAG: hypothetical protein EOP06_03750 [Pseudomonadota bacterium]